MRAKQGPHLSFPFHIADNGRSTVVTTQEQHVKEELLQILLTDPGERFFLPNFGGGVKRLVFEGLAASTFAMTKSSVTDAISKWLGHRVSIEDLTVEPTGNGTSGLQVSISYRVLGGGDLHILRIEKKGETP